MKLIDRYVYAVTERLPEDTREDVSRELRANIEDMLPENATESDIHTVLEKLGNPVKLANEYNDNKKYLIGPDLYHQYLSVLKLVMSIVPTVLAVISLIEAVTSSSNVGGLLENSIEVIVKVIAASIEGVMQSFMWVTLIFIILERTGVTEGNISFINKKWSVNDLPEVPVLPKRRIPRSEAVLSIVFTALFTALLYSKPHLIGLYTMADNGITLITPLFSIQVLQSYMFMILLLSILALSISIWKFISKQWSIPLAIVNAACNIAASVLVCIMISDSSLLNQDFLPKVAALIETPLSQITSMWSWGIRVTIPCIILINLWDSINGFVKCRHKPQN